MEKIKTTGILFHPMIASAGVLARELADFLKGRGIGVWLGSSWESEKARSNIPGTDLMLTIGGDGTILRSAQLVIGTGIPIIGVNLGHLGFMTEFSEAEAKEGLDAVLSGKGWIDERNMLEATVRSPENKTQRTFTALNDVVVARGSVARVVNINVTIDDTALTKYTADGVILATATGSTGYSLAAGGPIVYPKSSDILLLPILPHLCLPYPLLLPEKTTVGIRVSSPYAATLSIDGHTNLALLSESAIYVKQSACKTRFLRIHPENSFFSTLQQKLKGKRDAI